MDDSVHGTSRLNRIPDYATNSEHALHQVYVVKKYELERIREARMIVPSDTDLTVKHEDTRLGDIEHAYCLTLPIRRCDFFVIDLDWAGEDGNDLNKLINTLITWKLVQNIDVVISSAYVLEKDIHTDLQNYKYSAEDPYRTKCHVYVKLDGTYDCNGIFLTDIIKDMMCPGYWTYTMIQGETTIRISKKFNSSKLEINTSIVVGDSKPTLLRERTRTRTGRDTIIRLRAPEWMTTPLTMLSGHRLGSGKFLFKDFRDYIFSRMNTEDVHELIDVRKKEITTAKKLNLRQVI